MRVELQGIHKVFGPVHANKGISLILEPGSIYAVLGENGAGKSTLMKILSGFQKPTSGTILLDGKPAVFETPIDALQRGVGMVYQDPADFPPMRVVENHLLAYDNKFQLAFAAAADTLRTYAERFDFHIDPQVHVDSMTLGERQQMEVLRLLALGADLLILDEPTTGISAEQKDALFSTIRRLAYEDQKTIILVSHKLEEVLELCSEVFVLRQGELAGSLKLPVTANDLVKLMFGKETERTERSRIDPGRPVLALKHASFGDRRLTCEFIDLTLRESEVVGLAGLEGSGQGLLLRAAAGLIPLRDGKLTLDDLPVEGKRSPFFWLPWVAGLFFLIRLVMLIVGRVSGVIGGLALLGGIAVAAILGAAIWLIGEILIVWTSESAYHQFQKRGGAFVPAGRLEEGLVSNLTLTEHMALVTRDHQFTVRWDQAEAAIKELIQRYNIIGRPDSLVNELSGGNQQRTMLALLRKPLRLVLLEHPTRGLDITSANWIWNLFQERRLEGTAILFMSADLDELRERSDRIAVFSGGEMVGLVNANEVTVEDLGHMIGGQRT
jgi:general nucleoside transport system ATP-binding protein